MYASSLEPRLFNCHVHVVFHSQAPQPYQDLYVQSARDSKNAGEFSGSRFSGVEIHPFLIIV